MGKRKRAEELFKELDENKILISCDSKIRKVNNEKILILKDVTIREEIEVSNAVLILINCKFENFKGNKSAIRIYNNSLVLLKDCRFINFSNGATAITVKDNSEVKLIDCHFEKFIDSLGISGIDDSGMPNFDGRVSLRGCHFRTFSNRAMGIEVGGDSRLELENCKFFDFSESFGIHILGSAQANLKDNTTFTKFRSSARSVMAKESSKAEIENCEFIDFSNSFGVLILDSSQVTLKSCSSKDFKNQAMEIKDQGTKTPNLFSCEFEKFKGSRFRNPKRIVNPNFKSGKREFEGILIVPSKTTLRGQDLQSTLIKAKLIILGENCTLSNLTIDAPIISLGRFNKNNVNILKEEIEIKEEGKKILLPILEEAEGKITILEGKFLEGNIDEEFEIEDKVLLAKNATFNSSVQLKGSSLGIFINCTFEKFESETALTLENKSKALLADCRFEDFKNEASGAEIQDKSKVLFKKCKFINFYVSAGFSEKTEIYPVGTVIFDSAEVTFSNCSFEDFREGARGIEAQGDSTTHLTENCRFKKFESEQTEGVFISDSAKALFTDCHFEVFKDGAMGIFASDNSEILMENCWFRNFKGHKHLNSKLLYAVGISISDSAKADVENCNFKDFKIGAKGVKSEAEICLKGCTFEDFNGSDHITVGVIIYTSDKSNLEDCTFKSFNSGARGVEVGNDSEVSLKNCRFEDFKGLKRTDDRAFRTTGVSIYDSARVTVEGREFKNFKSGAKGVEVQDNSEVSLKNCRFEDFGGLKRVDDESFCTAGVSIYGSARVTVEGREFKNFKSGARGIEIYKNNKFKPILNCEFKGFEGEQTTGIFVLNSAESLLTECRFEDFENGATGVYVLGDKPSLVYLVKCRFKNFLDRTVGVKAEQEGKVRLADYSFEGFCSSCYKVLGNAEIAK